MFGAPRTEGPVDLDPNTLVRALGTRWLGRSLEVRAETRSTNDDVRQAAVRGAPIGHVIVADRQTHGRGTRGRGWSSPGGTDLYFSMLVAQGSTSPHSPLTTLACGLGVAAAVREFVGSGADDRVGIKWPNDVLIDDRKCSGILAETSSIGSLHGPLVVGVGLNVNREAFDADIATTSTSLRTACGGARLDRARVLAEALEGVEEWIERLRVDGAPPVVRALEAQLAYRARLVHAGDRLGTVVAISEDGALVLEHAGRTFCVAAGRIELASNT